MKTLKSILKYIFLLLANLLKLLKEMFFSKTKTANKKEIQEPKKETIKEEKKITPKASTPPKDDGIKTIQDEINYNLIAREYIHYVLEKKYEINKYDRNEEVMKEVEKLKEKLSPTLEELIIENPNSDYYKTTIKMIEKEVKENDKIKELKKIIFPIVIKKETKELFNKQIEEAIEKEIELEFYEDQEFTEEDLQEHITEFTKVISTIKIEETKIIEKETIEEEQTKIKKQPKEEVIDNKPKETKQEKDNIKKETPKEEEKHDDTIYLKLINNINNSINKYKDLLTLEQSKTGLEYKNYENINKDITKDIKRYEYLLIAYKHQLTPTQIHNISLKINQLENTKHDISESLEVDVKVEEDNLSNPIDENERNTIQNELDKVSINTKKYNLNSLEEIDNLSPEDIKVLEKRLLLDKFKDMIHLKPTTLYKLPFMKKNHFLNFSSSLLINANIKQLFNILKHQTNNNYNYNLYNIDNNQDALNNNESLNENNIDELTLFKSTILKTHPHLALDPEINMYLNLLNNNLSSRKARLTNKQKIIKKYCHNRVRTRVLIK